MPEDKQNSSILIGFLQLAGWCIAIGVGGFLILYVTVWIFNIIPSNHQVTFINASKHPINNLQLKLSKYSSKPIKELLPNKKATFRFGYLPWNESDESSYKFYKLEGNKQIELGACHVYLDSMVKSFKCTAKFTGDKITCGGSPYVYKEK